MVSSELNFVFRKKSPFSILYSWKNDIKRLNLLEPDAACLITTNGLKPSGRMILIKDISDKGLIFFTNYNSQKAKDIFKNPRVSVLIYFDKLQRQIRIQGICKKIGSQISDDYFSSRSYESKISAKASSQSSRLSDKKILENKIEKLKQQYPKEVPRPKLWGGFIVQPNYFEFWMMGRHRTHDRVCFKKSKFGWRKFLLQP